MRIAARWPLEPRAQVSVHSRDFWDLSTVDAIAFGKRSLIVIECKFSEPGSGCSQPNLIAQGAHKGLRQCSGEYKSQTNPVNTKTGRCALTEKGIRYWETIPQIFGVAADQDCIPCPFKGEAFQWMRNVVLAERLAKDRGVFGTVIAAFADGDSFPTAKKVRAGILGHAPATGARLIIPLSYDSIVALAQSLSDEQNDWIDLAIWVKRKIESVVRT